MASPNTKNGILRLLQIAGRRKYQLLLSAILALVHSATALIPYILVYEVIRQLLVPPVDMASLRPLLIGAAVAGLVSYGFLYLAGILSHIAAFNILYELRRESSERLGRLPTGALERYDSGTLKKILVDDVERIEGFIAHQIPDFFKGLTLPLVTVGYLFYVDWRLAAVSMAPLLFLGVWFPYVFSRPRTKQLMKLFHSSNESMNAGIVEYVRALPVMKIFGQSADSFEKYSGTVRAYEKMSVQWLRESAPTWAVFMSFMSNALLPILILGTWLYLSQGLGLGTFFLFLILGVGYIKPVFALGNMGMEISLINRGVQRLDEVLAHPSLPVEEPQGEMEDASVAFRGVHFSYVPGQKVLEDVGFEVRRGTMTALVGPSGSGKSTIAQLTARYWDIQAGEITIGGRDIRSFTPESLMDQVAYVFQDNFMFHLDIYENIRMGMDKTPEEVEAAARAAQCHDFISELPRGYHTVYGAAGTHLSGGEKQRIQLARAILKDPPILILDEATAFSDPENEYLIQRAIGNLIEHKTTIIIAHRLYTIMNADQIVVLDKGKIAGKGRHDDLLVHTPLYARMWEAHTQTQSFSIR